jgi:DNA-binding transcriptional LysR family regulator
VKFLVCAFIVVARAARRGIVAWPRRAGHWVFGDTFAASPGALTSSVNAPVSIGRGIEIRQLRYFLVLAEECNFRRAAERLHITQPPLSRQVAALEAALGQVLFERGPVSTRLTPAGERAREAFAAAVQAFDDALRRVAGGGEARPLLRLGLPWWVDMSRVPPFEAALRRGEGLSQLEVHTGSGPELQRLLLRRRLDAALITMPQDLQGLLHRPLARVPHVALVPASSALARKRAVRLRDLQDLTFLRFTKPQNPALWMHFQQQYDAAAFRPAHEAPAPGTAATIAQIAAGRGATLMPAAFARQRHAGVVARRLLDPVFVDVHLVFADGLDETSVGRLQRHAPLLAAALR